MATDAKVFSSWTNIRNVKWTDTIYRNATMVLQGVDGYALDASLIPYESNLGLNDKDQLVFRVEGDLPPWLHDRNGVPLLVTTGKYELQVVPESKKREVLKAYFEDPMLGGFRGRITLHQKLKATCLGISQRDITAFLSSQEIAQLTKPASNQVKVVKPITEQNGPFHYWQTDLIDLKNFQDGKIGQYKYILSVIDIFSKFAFFRALTNRNGPTVVKAFRDICLDFGAPKILGSDNGSEFISDEFKSMCTKFGIEQRLGTAYVSTSQGQVERANGAFKRILFDFFITTNTQNFTSVTRDIQYCINNSVASHGFTPYQIMFGREPTQVSLSAQLSAIEWGVATEIDEESGETIDHNTTAIEQEDGTAEFAPVGMGLSAQDIKKGVAMFKKNVKFVGEPTKAQVASFKEDLEELGQARNKVVKEKIAANAEKMVAKSKAKQKGEYQVYEVGDQVRISMKLQEKAAFRLKGLVESSYAFSKSVFQISEVFDDDDPIRYGLEMLSDNREEVDAEWEVTRRYGAWELRRAAGVDSEDRIKYTASRKVDKVAQQRVLRPAGVRKKK